MPKRPCPFEDNLLPQLKIHVGQKQVDNGVSHEERMKIIYGKTMDLLKKGVKTLSQRLNTSMELNPVDVPPSRISSSYKFKHERHSKQMTLNSTVFFFKYKINTFLFLFVSCKDTQPKYDLCECNRVIDQSMFSKCSYCDQILCNFCLLECIGCSELFCKNCSLPVYDYEEQSKCLNCYK
ncbi:hypothetical protein WN51_02968 [Melipona quadrifasciata]|uniref:Apoptosis regulatory protein Siva n=1 Tax=Melipona quadrifasciata TaxID=166423 RepID=A0A0N0U4X4_9HYME|nr:hypothetical protein WN51_02968 [Melipona quadrifasciata]